MSRWRSCTATSGIAGATHPPSPATEMWQPLELRRQHATHLGRENEMRAEVVDVDGADREGRGGHAGSVAAAGAASVTSSQSPSRPGAQDRR